jgi:hypothetical protein
MTANSATSGHTPPTLSPLFGPLLFGLGPPTLAFHHTYIRYLWTTNATEHLILAYIRWQATPAANSPSAASLGVPTSLKQWIRGYPSMPPLLHTSPRPEKALGQSASSPSAETSACTLLISSAQLLPGARNPVRPLRAHSPTNADSPDWDRIAPTNLRLPPRYSDAFKKCMDLPSNVHPDLGPGSNSKTLSTTISRPRMLVRVLSPHPITWVFCRS